MKYQIDIRRIKRGIYIEKGHLLRVCITYSGQWINRRLGAVLSCMSARSVVTTPWANSRISGSVGDEHDGAARTNPASTPAITPFIICNIPKVLLSRPNLYIIDGYGHSGPFHLEALPVNYIRYRPTRRFPFRINAEVNPPPLRSVSY
jgi:hypothetical protein